jgi:hypothetical protein
MDKPDIEMTPTGDGKAFRKVTKAKRAGRPAKLDKVLISKLSNYLRMGVYLETALVMVDITRPTFKDYCKKGREKPKSIYGLFLAAIDRALAEADIRDLSVIDKTAQGFETEFATYPQGYIDEHGVDRSGQIVFDDVRYGKKAVVKRPGIPPNWQAAAWKLAQRAPLKYTVNKERESLMDDFSKDEDNLSIEFIRTGHGEN